MSDAETDVGSYYVTLPTDISQVNNVVYDLERIQMVFRSENKR